MPAGKDLGTMLVDAGKISSDQLTQALSLVEKGKGRLEQVLIQIGAVNDEEELTSFIGKQLNIGAIRLSDLELNPDIVKLIPQRYCAQVQCHCREQARQDAGCRDQ